MVTERSDEQVHHLWGTGEELGGGKIKEPSSSVSSRTVSIYPPVREIYRHEMIRDLGAEVLMFVKLYNIMCTV